MLAFIQVWDTTSRLLERRFSSFKNRQDTRRQAAQRVDAP
jgi:hypothetical protein